MGNFGVLRKIFLRDVVKVVYLASIGLIEKIFAPIENKQRFHKGFRRCNAEVNLFFEVPSRKIRYRSSKQVREYWDQWQRQRLFLFPLPKSSSAMNLVTPEWHQLKTCELAGQIFTERLDLASPLNKGSKLALKKEDRKLTVLSLFPNQIIT